MPSDPTQTTLSDDEMARDDPDSCSHGWSILHPQPCPECEVEKPSENTTPEIHICRGVNRRFVSQTRLAGHRKWITACESERYEDAVMSMAAAFCAGDRKRGRVLMTADYYDPIIVAEMHK